MLMGARGMLDRVVYCSRTATTSFSAIPTELSRRYILLVEALVNNKKKFHCAHKLVHLCSVIDYRSQCRLSTMSLQKVARVKIRQIFQIPFRRMQIDKQNHVTLLLKRFHLDGHFTGFRPQTQKLDLPYKTPRFT